MGIKSNTIKKKKDEFFAVMEATDTPTYGSRNHLLEIPINSKVEMELLMFAFAIMEIDIREQARDFYGSTYYFRFVCGRKKLNNLIAMMMIIFADKNIDWSDKCDRVLIDMKNISTNEKTDCLYTVYYADEDHITIKKIHPNQKQFKKIKREHNACLA